MKLTCTICRRTYEDTPDNMESDGWRVVMDTGKEEIFARSITYCPSCWVRRGNPMTPEMKQQIDSIDYESLLRLWRYAPVGDPMFQGETGKYYAARMRFKRMEEGADHVRASKNIGWRTG